jgi:hypothetical protein
MGLFYLWKGIVWQTKRTHCEQELGHCSRTRRPKTYFRALKLQGRRIILQLKGYHCSATRFPRVSTLQGTSPKQAAPLPSSTTTTSTLQPQSNGLERKLLSANYKVEKTHMKARGGETHKYHYKLYIIILLYMIVLRYRPTMRTGYADTPTPPETKLNLRPTEPTTNAPPFSRFQTLFSSSSNSKSSKKITQWRLKLKGPS